MPEVGNSLVDDQVGEAIGCVGGRVIGGEGTLTGVESVSSSMLSA